jgi:hypothetical protein
MRGRVVLLGDSNAGHFTEPLVAAADRAGLTATVATLSSCPFLDVGVIGLHTTETVCRHFYLGTLAELVRHPPTVVVLASRTDDYIEGGGTLRKPNGTLTTDPDQKARLWQQGLTSTLAGLNRAGIAVIVVHPTPEFPYTPSECAVIRVLTNACDSSISRTQVAQRLRRSLDAENEAVAHTPNSSTLDLTDELCNAQRCSTTRGATILYRDTNHLSIDGAQQLTPRFYTALLSAR